MISAALPFVGTIAAGATIVYQVNFATGSAVSPLVIGAVKLLDTIDGADVVFSLTNTYGDFRCHGPQCVTSSGTVIYDTGCVGFAELFFVIQNSDTVAHNFKVYIDCIL